MATESIRWVEPDGAEHDLTGGAPTFVLLGIEGRHMPPVDLHAEDVPRQPGARLREVRFREREIDLPLRIVADSPAQRDAITRQIMRWFNPARAADGRLRVTTADGLGREVACRYVSGLDFRDDLGAWRTDWRTVVVLRAHDPFWYDLAEWTADFALGEVAGSFFPVPPLRLSSSTVFAAPTVDNPGDVETWPVWTVTGPGTNPVIRNLTTGKALALVGSLAPGERLTIDTRPGRKSIARGDGANWFPNLVVGSALWPLATGANALQIELTDADAGSAVSYNVRPRYLSI